MQWKYAGRSLLVALVVIAIAAGVVIAQQQIAATESGIREAQPFSGVRGAPERRGAVLAALAAAGHEVRALTTEEGRLDDLYRELVEDGP